MSAHVTPKLLKDRELTFRFAPALPAAADFLPVSLLGSFGRTLKNPSRRPCCFWMTPFWSFSAPFRTRSSLRGEEEISQSSYAARWEATDLKPFSRTRKSIRPSTSGDFHSSWMDWDLAPDRITRKFSLPPRCPPP